MYDFKPAAETAKPDLYHDLLQAAEADARHGVDDLVARVPGEPQGEGEA